MMSLQSLRLFNIRNVREQALDFSEEINIFFGSNGSGKTTFLESIHVLGRARSFRTTRLNHMISHDEVDACIEAQLSSSVDHATQVKLKKNRNKRPQFLLENKPVSSAAEIAQMLPVQLLNLHGYQLLASPPEGRRKFLDWMMFHVKHEFLGLWQDYHRLLKQRNAALRDYKKHHDLNHWTAALVRAGESLDLLRKEVLDDWIPYAFAFCEGLPGVKDLRIEFIRGWPSGRSLIEQLDEDFERDRYQGYTHSGPHRADLDILVQNQNAQHILSTGQQKTFVSMLQISQARWLSEYTGQKPILLIDDLPSELDVNTRGALFEQIEAFPAQIFLTGVEKQGVTEGWGKKSKKMFHVKHGTVQEVV